MELLNFVKILYQDWKNGAWYAGKFEQAFVPKHSFNQDSFCYGKFIIIIDIIYYFFQIPVCLLNGQYISCLQWEWTI